MNTRSNIRSLRSTETRPQLCAVADLAQEVVIKDLLSFAENVLQYLIMSVKIRYARGKSWSHQVLALERRLYAILVPRKLFRHSFEKRQRNISIMTFVTNTRSWKQTYLTRHLLFDTIIFLGSSPISCTISLKNKSNNIVTLCTLHPLSKPLSECQDIFSPPSQTVNS